MARISRDSRASLNVNDTQVTWYAVLAKVDEYKVLRLIPKEVYLAHKKSIDAWQLTSNTYGTPVIELVYEAGKLYISGLYRNLLGAKKSVTITTSGPWLEVWNPADHTAWCTKHNPEYDVLAARQNLG